MYLKKIHIQGFKSFADKTEIDFKDNITAIVGPNGSGKSNISDAIRWVLGEQSIKNLRGNKMEDIIFAGTNKRRSLSFSEVTIFFDNKEGIIPLEYSEVAITRRMFRSGESEYYINKNSCRLKDVRELFMDTGIGKDGYSIIGQGRIDEVLSNKPEDRRNIFEEAAGIIKYRTKKEESERKLKKTEENLIRIDDLIHEISSNFKKLKKDSKKADVFVKCFNELKELETNIYINDIKKINTQIETLDNNKSEIVREIKDNKSKREEKQVLFDNLKVFIKEKESTVEILRDNRDEIIRRKEETKSKLSLLVEKEVFYNKDLKRIDEDLNNKKNSNIELETELDYLSHKTKSLSNEYNELTLRKNKKRDKLDSIEEEINNKEKYLNDIRKETNLLYEKIVERKGVLNNVNFLSTNSDKKIIELKDEKELLDNKTIAIVEELETLNHNEVELNQRMVKLSKNKLIAQNKKEKLQMEISEYLKKKQDLEIKIERMNSSYELFKNMEHSYEGYYKSVKNLLRAIENNKVISKGYHGTIADLFTVEERYEMAINISLGGNIQNIVVNNEDIAKSMINYLKKNTLGRVTFLPLESINGKTLNVNNMPSEDYGILGLANELVKYDNRYEEIFKSLLGRTIIIDTIDNAVRFAKSTNYVYRIITLEGELLNPGGSLSGGSYKNNISIINRKSKIKTMKEQLNKLKVELNNNNSKQLYVQKNYDINEECISNLNSVIETINNKLINSKHNLKSIIKDKEFIETNKTNIELEIENLLKVVKENTNKTQQDKNLLKTDVEKLENLKKDIDLREKHIRNIKINREKLYDELNNLNISIKLMENKILNYNQKTSNTIKNIDDNKIFITKMDQEIKELKKSIDDVIIENQDLNVNVSESTKLKKEVEYDIQKNIKEKEIYMDNFYLEQNNLKALNEDVNTLDSAKNDIDLKTSKLILEAENIQMKLYDDYKLSIEDAISLIKPMDNINESRNRVKTLKKEIKNLGHVNLGALEEYKEVKERLEFMETQYDDLVDSKENLRTVIRDMEKEMKINFLKSFEEIKNNFSIVFTELFNGGTATLELEDDDDDLLTSGIEIKVKPPGKVFQSLSLLSGGEKTLVAIALLFALLKTKPSPFCVLDEIDAALDDSNINRYTTYLEKIKGDTQFILITHRKTSMEIANILYGVTMEEKGISKIISMKLKDDKESLVS